MKLTNTKIIEALGTREETSEINFPVKVSFKLAKNYRELLKEAETIALEEMKLVDKYADRDEKGEKISAGENCFKCEQNEKEFVEKHKELMEIEVDVNIETIKIDELENVYIKSKILENIMFMIEE